MSATQSATELFPTLLQVLLHQEERYYSLWTSSKHSFHPILKQDEAPWKPSAGARNKIGEWALRITDHYDFPRDCVSVALNLIDRMVLLCPCSSCQDYQLLAVASVFLSIKLSGNTRVLPVRCIAHHSQVFTKESIIEQEYNILCTLQWHVHPPTAVDFLYHYWNALLADADEFPVEDRQDILDTATFLIEHSYVDAFFSLQRPSIIAMAALSLTIQVQVPAFLDAETVFVCRRRLHELALHNTAAAQQQQRTRSPISITTKITNSSDSCVAECHSSDSLTMAHRISENKLTRTVSD